MVKIQIHTQKWRISRVRNAPFLNIFKAYLNPNLVFKF